MNLQTSHYILAVVVVGGAGSIAVEHAEIVGDQGEVLAFRLEEVAAGHDTDVTAQAADTAHVAVTDEFLNALAIIENFEVDGVDGALQGEGGLKLTDLDGEFVAGFVLHKGVDHHGGAAEVALNLVGEGLGEFALDGHTDAAHSQGVALEIEILIEIGLIEALDKA